MQTQAISHDYADSAPEQQQLELATLIERCTGRNGAHEAAIAKLFLLRSFALRSRLTAFWEYLIASKLPGQ